MSRIPAHGKDLSDSLLPRDTAVYKALLVSFDNLDPMPAGELYCCDFLGQFDSPGECCEIAAQRPGASDPFGELVPTSVGPPGQICLARDGVVEPTATPTPTELVPTATPSTASVPTATIGGPPTPAAEDDDGCAVQPARAPSATSLVWSLMAIGFAMRRSRAGRSRL